MKSAMELRDDEGILIFELDCDAINRHTVFRATKWENRLPYEKDLVDRIAMR